jgi:uncharacterized GH25 family protein
MRKTLKWLLLAVCVCVPMVAQAHRMWLMPSVTIVSGDDIWITVDAAVSDDLFYFDHNPLRIANIGTPPAGLPPVLRTGRGADLMITAPDGSKVEAHNGSMGRFRSTFDVHLTQKGTYRIAVRNEGVFARYKVGNEEKRWRGTADVFGKEVPANAEELRATLSQSRVETFVTLGKPSRDTLKTTGSGMEFEPITHPNDLVAGSPATFRLILDGKPASGVSVTVVPGGRRYRDRIGEMTLTTDQDGKFTVTWSDPGMYWMQAVVRDAKTEVDRVAERRAAYVATLEVLPQ